MRDIRPAIGLLIVALSIPILLYFCLGTIASIPAPEAGDEGYEEYSSLTDIVQLSFKGWEAVLVFLILAVMIVVFGYMYSNTRHHY